MSKFPVRALTTEQIHQQANPAVAGQPEAIAAVLFDTQTLLLAGVAALTFFQSSTLADETLSNVLGGNIPEGYSFKVSAFGMDILREPSTDVGLPGVLSDIARILKTNRATFEFQKSSKTYGKVPATFLHASGGETGGLSSTVATSSQQFANNGIFDGGFDVDGSIIIQPKEPFKAIVSFAPTFVALLANTPIRVWMRGTLYRPVR